MKRNTLFGAAGLLVAGAAIGAGAVVSQNAMASDGQVETANALTMINIGEDGTAVQCTFTGADAEALMPTLPPGIPTDDAAKAEANGQMVVGVANITPVEGPLPEIDASSGVIVGAVPVGDVPAGSLPAGAVPVGAVQASGVITVGASTADGKVTISGVGADGAPIAAPEVREGTAEECAAMHTQTLADLQNLQDQVAANGGTVINVSTEAGVTTEP